MEEGQLQQAEARNRKAAVADEAVADAKREEAAQELREASREAAEQKGAAARPGRSARSPLVERQRDASTPPPRARPQRAGGRGSRGRREHGPTSSPSPGCARPRPSRADATSTEQEAAAEKRRLEREAAAADQQAAQLRAQTEK